jgi:DNA polymerase-3 subunit alpha
VTHFSGQLIEAQNGEPVRVAGLITTVRPYVTKAGKPMGFVTIEDIQGVIELVLFPRAWEKTRMQLTADQIVIVDGKVDTSNTPPKVLVDAVRTDLEAAAAEVNKARPVSQRRPAARDDEAKGPHPVAPPTRPRPASSTGPASPVVAPGAASPPAQVPPDDGFPPPPENFPADWEIQWQPTFDNADVASRAPVGGDSAPAASNSAASSSPASPTVRSQGRVEPAEVLPSAIGPVPATAARKESAVFAASGVKATRIPALPSLYVPLAEDHTSPEHPPKQITILLRSTGDRERDRRRIKIIHGTLISFHGKDRFSFHIFEDGRGVLLDFPAATTHVCSEMLARLEKLMGEPSWRIEDITFH